LTWLLDTNVLSEGTKRNPSVAVAGWIRAQPLTALFTMSLALAELRSGIDRVVDPVRRGDLSHWLEFSVRPLFAGRVLEADEQMWLAMLRIAARAKVAGRTLPTPDIVFAAGAERHGLIVVTRSVRHFIGTGVRVVNPWDPAPTPIVT